MEHVSYDFKEHFAALITPPHENGLQDNPVLFFHVLPKTNPVLLRFSRIFIVKPI